MEIVVCVKQVPDVDDIKWTKENNLDREQMLSKINPQDEWAIDNAVNIKQKIRGTSITAISMGPDKAKEVLEYALAKGADRAILLSDKRFSGSDTLITAKIIARAIKKYIPDFDLIITGQAAVDGDTEQTPIGIATELGIPDVTNVVAINNADNKMVIAKQKLGEDGAVTEVKTPCLVAVKEECELKITPRIDNYIKAQIIKTETYNADDLGFSKEETGILGSPTMVYKAFRPQNARNAQEILDNTAHAIVDIILKAK